MAVFFLAALWKIRRPDFSFCKVDFAAALAGWIVINCVPVDLLVARNQVDRYLSGESQALSVEYLASLSYTAAAQLEPLAGRAVLSDSGAVIQLSPLLDARRAQAAAECADWRSWNLPALLFFL